jgi:hypothetical protein
MWADIKDSNVRNVWQCEDCNKLTYCTPDTYADIGTPICTDCDIDLYYVKTQVHIMGKKDETIL